MSFEQFTDDQLAAELAARRAAQHDASAADASAARANLASGGTGDVGAPDLHPHLLAKQAVNDGLTKQGLSHDEALALGVAQLANAALRGDVRAGYHGRVEPGA